MAQSTNRYSIGPGANVTNAFKASEYASWIRNEYGTNYFDNLALQQTLYQAIIQTIGEVAPTISQKVTWNYNVMPNIPGNYQAANAPQDITWDSDGNLVVNNYSMLLQNGSDYIIDGTAFPNITDEYPAAGILSSTPLKKGKFYLEIEILEDTNYYFMIAPVAWESSNLLETGSGSIAAIGADYWQFLTGRGHFAGQKYNDENLRNAEHSNVLAKRIDDFTQSHKYNEPFQAGDILQFAYDTDIGVAFLGINGTYARWNAAGSYTTMDGTNANTGMLIGGPDPAQQNTFALFAVPFRQQYPATNSFMPDERANCNVQILTGNACNYSPPVGYTDH
jgi:hypothetical protein